MGCVDVSKPKCRDAYELTQPLRQFIYYMILGDNQKVTEIRCGREEVQLFIKSLFLFWDKSIAIKWYVFV
jgi:hypothetical protein